MEDMRDLFVQFVDKLSEISLTLNDISQKMDFISDQISNGSGNDEIVSKLDDVANTIVGPTGYNLTDIFNEIQGVSNMANNIMGETGYNLTDIYKEIADINIKMDT